MKRKKILRISAVVASVLFALSIVVGVVLTCLHRSNDTVAYAAELDDDTEYNYWIRFKDDYYTLVPSVFVINETIPYSPDFDTSTTLSFDFPFIANGEYFTRFIYRQSAEDGVTFDYQNGSYSRRVFVQGELVADANYLNIAVGYCQMNTGLFAWFTRNAINVNDRSFAEGAEYGYWEGFRDGGIHEAESNRLLSVEISSDDDLGISDTGIIFPSLFYVPYGSSFTFPVLNNSLVYIERIAVRYTDPDTDVLFGYNYPEPGSTISNLTYNLKIGLTIRPILSFQDGYSEGVEDGYNQGFNSGYSSGHEEGYSDGYTRGHSDGLNLGQSVGIANPVSFFFDTTQTFLDIKLFGVVSIGGVLSVLLFVGVALAFIKMFGAG